ncbi:MAG TPA: zinc transporter ZupT [Deltaproteobacteria bacterium]|nr:MAG: zinc transporter ZupT [Deltaproteobacteria bacterium GWA2_55_82]OGQ63387.1 MAG: zinc transporter ZupT [Deltaproteobacteria bacterium RIFCSPLOWO2_02_FULL_55_12]OIJ73199.1 MAG: zinc transporter ZupT [Deltaproteobacteria bacterium GWC2_55_46]HBG45542.1 zinc transporter ZupT [Deltaproteobacteria bacterium]HCY10373.1 zinc transporter ZupT [Deltaproteobacteria bacterium]
MTDIWFALGLTVLAGMATGIGSAIAFFARRTNYRFLSVSTGFSAGVMLYVSFVEIFVKGTSALTDAYGGYWGHWVNAASFFGGILLIGLIDNLVPAAKNPHETHPNAETAPLHNSSAPMPDFAAIAEGSRNADSGMHDHGKHNTRLLRMGLFTALAIAIHNFPEGLATFLAALQSPGVGIAIAVAIALHNIPEGISVSVPIYYATGNRRKAFAYSVLSGLAEPVGAIAAYLILWLIVGNGGGVPPQVMGVMFGGIAGVMVYISLDGLLPTSRAYGKGHDSIFGLVSGMGLMALSLLLMK